MTNQEAIDLLNKEEVPMVLNGETNENLVDAHIKAIQALEEKKRIDEILKKIDEEIFQTARTVSVNGSTYVCFNDIRAIMHIYATDKDVGIKTRGDVIRKSNENLAEFVGYTVNYPYAHCTSMPESVDDYIFDILAYLNQPAEEE